MWYLNAAKPLDLRAEIQAKAHQNRLTKPQGSLGELENLSVRLAARQATSAPQIERIHISVFAADHGIAAEKVSAFPQVVTAEMVKNFANGGAAITVLAAQYHADFEIIDVGVAHSIEGAAGVIDARIARGTHNFLHEPAMSFDEAQRALLVGKSSAVRANKNHADLFIGGEMGIGNTTAASAILCLILGKSAAELTGAGTGLNAAGVRAKVRIIERALAKHRANTPLEILQTYGGFEIAALVGAMIGCAQQGITVLVDGFIATTAALLAVRLNPSVRLWLEFAHQSAEQAHKIVLVALDAKPLLDLGLRLGEGSGAALAIGLLQSACALHNQMATFAAAGVSEGDG